METACAEHFWGVEWSNVKDSSRVYVGKWRWDGLKLFAYGLLWLA